MEMTSSKYFIQMKAGIFKQLLEGREIFRNFLFRQQRKIYFVEAANSARLQSSKAKNPLCYL